MLTLDLQRPSVYHPRRWFRDGSNLNGATPRRRPADSEKITINLGFVDLGQIDLIVADGLYSNRTDFIRSAIRHQLERHEDLLRQSARRKNFALGLHDYTREQLEDLRTSGQTVHIRVIGLLRIAADVSPELASATIASVSVLGAIQASAAVKAVLANRVVS